MSASASHANSSSVAQVSEQPSSATLAALELPVLLRIVASFAATDLGRARIEHATRFTGEEALRGHRRQLEEVERLLGGGALVPSHEEPLAPLLDALVADALALDGRDLVALADVLRVSGQALRRVTSADPVCDSLALRVASLEPCGSLRDEIDRTLDARGEVRDDATPALSRLRERVRTQRSHLYDSLSGYVSEHKEHLSEDTVPLREGRLVLVLKSGARGRLPGLVHGRSGTGKSFYFEPLDAVEGNNRLRQAVDDESAERVRILRRLLELVRDAREVVVAHAAWLAELDQLQAYARYRETVDGRLADLGPRHGLRLVAARHPLIDPRLADRREEVLGTAGHRDPVVPLDLELDPTRRALVITGPNAGGKTVALKTVGLSVLCHVYGLPIAAAKGSSLPFLGPIVATVGDEQDLLADRSTFSGRLLRLGEAWEAAGEDALVLLDELGSGTDPEEGAALSIALLESLVTRGGLTLVTTHLTRVAAAALDHEGAQCAAMEFDPDRGTPTYRLRTGPPGGSEALALARRLGLPKAWLDRAEVLVSDSHRDLGRLLAEVERNRDALAQAREDLAQEHADAVQLRTRLATREAELARERKQLGKRLQRELDDFRKTTQARVREEIERALEAVRKGRRKGLVPEAVGALFEEAPTLIEEMEPEEVPVTVGGEVRHRQLGWRGTLEKLDRGKAKVRVAGKVFRCAEGDLVGMAVTPEAPSAPRSNRVKTPAVAVRRADRSTPELTEQPRELSLIGQRVEEALDQLDRFLDRSQVAGQATVRVIHGHGSGRLRSAVREHLKRHPSASAFRAGRDGEGGNGATMVTLRD